MTKEAKLCLCLAACLAACFGCDNRRWQETKLTAFDGSAHADFGTSVCLSADGLTAAVGAPGAGSVYLYAWDGVSWRETKLTAADGATDDDFGFHVGLSADGSAVIAGASYDDERGEHSGSAYVFRREGGSWRETKLTASDAGKGDEFGGSVDLSADGTIAVVGAWGNACAYVFRRDGAIWREEKLNASVFRKHDYFGYVVGISDDGSLVVVGAWVNHSLSSEPGLIYVYAWDGSSWKETRLTAPDVEGKEDFGGRLALSGDGSVIVTGVGASGSAYVYRRDGASWTENEIFSRYQHRSDSYGSAFGVSGGGTLVAVGASADDGKGPYAGRVYLYRLDDGSWEETKLVASDTTERDCFGFDLALSADGAVAAVGSPGDDEQGKDSGSAYIFFKIDGGKISSSRYPSGSSLRRSNR